MSNTNGGDRIQDVLFKILKKNDAVKGLQALCQTLWKTQQWPKNWKRSDSISVPYKDINRECSNYCSVVLISHVSRLTYFKLASNGIGSDNFQRYWHDLEKSDEPDQIVNIQWIMEK